MRRADAVMARPGIARPSLHQHRPSTTVDDGSGQRSSRFSLLRSVPFRMVLAVSTLYLACFGLSACVFYQLLRDRLDSEINQSISRNFSSVEDIYRSEGLDDVLKIARRRDQLPMNYNMGFHLATPNGRQIAGNVTLDVKGMGWNEFSGAELGLEDDGVRYRFFAGELGSNILSVGRSVQPLQDLRGTAISSFGWTLLSSLILALLGAGYISWRTHVRIQKIARAMDRVAAGNLEARLPISSACDGIDDLACQINQALTRLQQMVESVRQVSNDIAHDLKTPLNRLFIHIEKAAELTRQGERVDGELVQALSEAQDINATFEALLRIAQIEAGARRASFRTVDLLKLVETVAEIYEPVAEEQGQELMLETEGEAGGTLVAAGEPRSMELPIFGDRDLLLQMMVNLVENAIRHCPAGSRIIVQAGSSDHEVWFCIRDNGPGVPDAERNNVMRRLYRLEGSRTTEGTGLGLSLVKAVSDLHCGVVDLRNNNPGLNVCVTFARDCPPAGR